MKIVGILQCSFKLYSIWSSNMELHRQQARSSVRSSFLNMLKYVSLHIYFYFYFCYFFLFRFVSFKLIFYDIYTHTYIFFLLQSANRWNMKCYVFWFNAISFQTKQDRLFSLFTDKQSIRLIWNVRTLLIIVLTMFN